MKTIASTIIISAESTNKPIKSKANKSKSIANQ